ncbi:hypothetical protein [Paenibacillus woosongensis]|uniref:Uncharacterized protein n=1 Tax=Paenibacillus woosongensis TaxID=307580 RepID=A0A7X2YXB8_9BACL|nr:hypothetical protein [Paenibacillus woosongensis]MUG43547.1 hypothetical protein [Paenibacillus woosongensis]
MKKLITLFLIIVLGTTALIITIHGLSVPMKTAMTSSVEAESSEEAIPDMLTIKDENGHHLDLVIKDIPVYRAYLESQADIKTEMERTQFEVLHIPTEGHFILLKYNCGNKQCSTILVKKTDSKITSVALATGIFQDYKISPEEKEVLLKYGFNEGGEIVRHILITVDLLKMKVVPFESSELAKEYMDKPTWPIVNYQWIDHNRFMIELPDLESSEFETVKSWYASSEKKTKKVEVTIDKEKILDSYNAIEKEK